MKIEELQTYRCHKVVRAAKILRITEGPQETTFKEGSLLLWLGETLADAVEVGYREYVLRHDPQVGGYYVEYDDGKYASFSPAAPFEAGYTPIYPGVENPPAPTVNASQVRDAALKVLLDYFEYKSADADRAGVANMTLNVLEAK